MGTQWAQEVGMTEKTLLSALADLYSAGWEDGLAYGRDDPVGDDAEIAAVVAGAEAKIVTLVAEWLETTVPDAWTTETIIVYWREEMGTGGGNRDER
jgi:hypothetical protein